MSDGTTSVRVAAPPAKVWDLLSDITRMGEWSPECVGCRWLPPADRARPGARFRGTSRNGRHRWSTTSTVVDAVPARSFAFDVTYFRRPVARWRYALHEDGSATVISESVEDQRGRLLRAASPYITGTRDRARHNAATMKTTLERIKAEAEA
jgi:uncharacterized protein YndB with AHSA1/START domain